MFGQLVFNSIAIREVGPDESCSSLRRDWIAVSIEEREVGDEEVMLIMKGFDELGSDWIIFRIQFR